MASFAGLREEERRQVFPDLVRRSVRHHAGQDRAGDRDRHDGQVGRGLCRLRDVVRHDAGASRHAGDGGCRHAIQLPWKPEVAWVTGDLVMDGKPLTQNPRQVLKRVVDGRRQGRLRDEDRRRVRVLPDPARRHRDLGRRRHAGEALLRPAGADAPLRDHHGDLRCHDRRSAGGRIRTTTRTRTASSR